jgi:ornithine cyclodeaminase
MLTLDRDAIFRSNDFVQLIAALRKAFASNAIVPPRHAHEISRPNGQSDILLIMPAWQQSGNIGVKLINTFPNNASLGIPVINGSYVLFEGSTGRAKACLDGGAITQLRTPAVSVLAATFLARPSSSTLLLLATGVLAPGLIDAYRAAFPIERVMVWSWQPEEAHALLAKHPNPGIETEVVEDLALAIPQADIVCAATRSECPLIRGAKLLAGTHVDLIGAFKPNMRESDTETILRSRVYIDSTDALIEPGDLVVPIAQGSFSETMVVGSLAELCTGRVMGRRADDEITLFKAVGNALADLAAAEFFVTRCQAAGRGDHVRGEAPVHLEQSSV